MSVRLTLWGSPAAREGKSWLLGVDEAKTVSEVARSLGPRPQLLARAAESVTRLAEAGLVSGPVIPPVSRPEPNRGTVRLEVVGAPFAASNNGSAIERGDRRIPLTGSAERVDVLRGDVLWVGDVRVEPVPL